MFNIFKPKHEHDWELVAVNDKYYTTYTDTGKTKYWSMRFYRCACGERKYSDDRTSSYYVHEGMDKVKANWIDTGVVPLNSYHPSQSQYYVKIDDLAKQYQDAEGEIPEAIAEYVSKIKPLIWIVTDNGIGTLKSRDLFIEEVYGKFDEHFTKYEN